MDEQNTRDRRAASKLNAVKHGCRAKTVILPNENPSDFDAVWERWMIEFQPADDAALQFVEQVILNDWYLQRILGRHREMETKLGEKNFLEWTPEDHKQAQLSNRYLNEAQRALDRSIRSADCWRKNREQEKRRIDRENRRAYLDFLKDDRSSWKQERHALHEQIRALEKSVPAQKPAQPEQKSTAEPLFQGQNHPKKQRKIHTLEQWAEITVEDGKTVTRLFPSNEELIEDGKAMNPPPDLIYRRLNFVNGVPPEYRWSTKDEERWRYGGAGIQRMTVDTWLEAIEREKHHPDGHLGPVPNLPRPRERGGCDCEVCTKNQAILDGLESDT